MQRKNYPITDFRILILTIGLLVFCACKVNKQTEQEKAECKRVMIMGLGDSITEGGENFQSYLFPLWEHLFAAGYKVDFVGPRSSNSRIGKIKHCGFSGKNAEFLETQIDSIYREYPADIVLLHSGHNHFNTENPVNGIINAQKSIIEKILTINPDAKVLVAKVIESGKLPKYSYIPKLNNQIEKMVEDLNLPNVILVDQSKNFNWEKHSISDKVHPSPGGAEVMAEAWFEGLKHVLPEPTNSFHPEIVQYKITEQGNLALHIFKPKESAKHEKHPVIVFFFAGGWSLGMPLQFYRECDYYASKGFVAISVDYRIKYLHHTTPFESVEDAKDAVRWIRRNAEKLNIDSEKIVAAGSSAGGHLTAAIGTLKEKYENETDDYKSNLMLLYYPVVDNSVNGYGPEIIKKRYHEISPMHNIDAETPPALFVLGTEDSLIPVKTAEEFKARMEENGVECESHLIEGAGHPIFYYAKDLTPEFYNIRELTDQFLSKYGYLKSE